MQLDKFNQLFIQATWVNEETNLGQPTLTCTLQPKDITHLSPGQFFGFLHSTEFSIPQFWLITENLYHVFV